MAAFWEERTPRERKMLIAFAALAVIGGGFKVASGSPSGPVTADGGTPHAAVGVTDPQGSPVDTETNAPTTTHPVLRSDARDPFQPLVSVSDGTGAAAPEGAAPAPEASPTPAAEEGKSLVALQDIVDEDGVRYADLIIDGKLFTVKTGQYATKTIKVLWLSNRCGTFANNGKRFALCVGQSITG